MKNGTGDICSCIEVRSDKIVVDAEKLELNFQMPKNH